MRLLSGILYTLPCQKFLNNRIRSDIGTLSHVGYIKSDMVNFHIIPHMTIRKQIENGINKQTRKFFYGLVKFLNKLIFLFYQVNSVGEFFGLF